MPDELADEEMTEWTRLQKRENEVKAKLWDDAERALVHEQERRSIERDQWRGIIDKRRNDTFWLWLQSLAQIVWIAANLTIVFRNLFLRSEK